MTDENTGSIGDTIDDILTSEDHADVEPNESRDDVRRFAYQRDGDTELVLEAMLQRDDDDPHTFWIRQGRGHITLTPDGPVLSDDAEPAAGAYAFTDVERVDSGWIVVSEDDAGDEQIHLYVTDEYINTEVDA